MRDIYIKSKAGLLPIGRRGENLATRVIYPGVPEEGQAVTVYVMRNGDTVAYPASQVEVTDTEIIWTVTSIDTGKSGRGKVQYRFSDSVTGEIIKTDIYAFMVGLAIDTEVGPAPDPYETWLDSLTELASETQLNAESASQSAEDARGYAESIQTMTVEAETLPEGSSATASWADGTLSLGIPTGATGPQGETGATGLTGPDGADGYSPSASVTQSGDVTTIIITDKEGTTTESIDLSDYAHVITDTASGPIASFTDGADGMPVKSLVVRIEPVQDLHGYDNPWPAGGGVNLLDPSTVTLHSSTVYGFTLAWDSTTGALTLSGTFTGTGTTASFRAIHVPSAIRAYNVVGFSASSNFNRLRWQVDEDVIVCELRNMVTNNAYNITVYPVVYEGDSTPTAYSPYSNICPISGWTGAKVQRTGKNLLYPKYSGRTQNGITFTVNADGTISSSGTATGGSCAAPNLINEPDKMILLHAGTYCLSGGKSANKVVYLGGRYADGTAYSAAYDRGAGATYVFTKDVYVYPQINITNGTETDDTFYIQLELGSTATAYEPYQGETYDITFPSEAGTVYGGSLDVTQGVLTVDKAMVDLGTLTWDYRIGEYAYSYFATVSLGLKKAGSTNLVCSKYKTATGGRNTLTSNCMIAPYNISNSKTICIRDDAYSDATSFANSLSGVQLVYELATPITYQLTPTEVKTLLGANSIFADTGNTEVTYRADTKRFIQKAIQEALSQS